MVFVILSCLLLFLTLPIAGDLDIDRAAGPCQLDYCTEASLAGEREITSDTMPIPKPRRHLMIDDQKGANGAAGRPPLLEAKWL